MSSINSPMMSMLPPSPNWYCAQIVSTSVDGGVVAIGCKEQIILFDTGLPDNNKANPAAESPANQLSPQILGILGQHSDRVTSVAFSPRKEQQRKLASSGADLQVVVWDVDLQTSIATHTTHEVEVIAVCWSLFTLDRLLSVDKGGTIVVWNPDTQHTSILVRKAGNPSCIVCSPYNADHVAVGFKKGTITIYNIRTGSIIHRLHGHQDEIQSIHWQPPTALEQRCWRTGAKVESEQIASITDGEVGNNREHGLLASGSKDKTIRIWDVNTGKIVQNIDLPRAPGPSAAQKRERIWVAVLWSAVEKNTLYTSSHNGNMLVWNLRDSKPANKKLQGVQHNRPVFGLAPIGWESKYLVTVSMDRQIIFWDASRQTSITSFQSLGGYAYCTAITDLDPRKVAIGVGDGTIRVWSPFPSESNQIAQISNKSNNCIVLWKGLQAKVTAVVWHPDVQGLLAFGTEEGQVGTYDIHSQKYTLMSTYHRGTVYSLGWRLPPAQATEETILETPSDSIEISAASIDPPVDVSVGTLSNNHITEPIPTSTPPVIDISKISKNQPTPFETPLANIVIGKSKTVLDMPNKEITEIELTEITPSSDVQGDSNSAIDGSVGVLGENMGKLEGSNRDGKEGAPEIIKKKQRGKKVKKDRSQANYLLWSLGGDSVIYEHNTRNSNSDSLDITQALGGLDGTGIKKIMKRSEFAWHSTNRIVAIGNADGSVEILRNDDFIKVHQFTVHTKSINRLVWQHPHASSIVPGSSDWLASGSDDQNICIYNIDRLGEGEPKLIQTLRGHAHRITNLCWVPMNPSRLASSSFDNSVQIWDVVTGAQLANYRGHSGRVFSVSCSFTDPDVFVSGSEDQTVRVWRASQQKDTSPPQDLRKLKKAKAKQAKLDQIANESNDSQSTVQPSDDETIIKTTVDDKQPIETTDEATKVMNHSNALDSAMAAFLLDEIVTVKPLEDQSMIIGASETTSDNTTTINRNMDISSSQLFSKEDTDVLNQNESLLDKTRNRIGDLIDEEDSNTTHKADLKDDTSKDKIVALDDVRATDTNTKKERKLKTLLQLCTKVDTAVIGQMTCIHVATSRAKCKRIDHQANIATSLSVDTSLYTGHRRDLLELLNKEATNHGESLAATQLLIWSGNIVGAIKSALCTRSLSDYLVGLSAAAGPSVWRHTCLAYAEQLEEIGEPHKAVTYYLAVGEVKAAISVYQKVRAYRDALAIARLRLLPNDPIIMEITLEWAAECERRGSFEHAAKCFIAVGDIDAALTALGRKNTADAYAAAAEVATAYNHPLAPSLTSTASSLLHSSGQFARARSFYSHCGNNLHSLAVLAVDESLSYPIAIKSWADDCSDIIPLPDWTSASAKQLYLKNNWFSFVLRQWKGDGLLNSSQSLTSILERLSYDVLNVNPPSLLITQGIIYLMIGSVDRCLDAWLSAISQSYDGKASLWPFRVLVSALGGANQEEAESRWTNLLQGEEENHPELLLAVLRIGDFCMATELAVAAKGANPRLPRQKGDVLIGLDDTAPIIPTSIITPTFSLMETGCQEYIDRWMQRLLNPGWFNISLLSTEREILANRLYVLQANGNLSPPCDVAMVTSSPIGKEEEIEGMTIDQWLEVNGECRKIIAARLARTELAMDKGKGMEMFPFPNPIKTVNLLIALSSQPMTSEVRACLIEHIDWCLERCPTNEIRCNLESLLSWWPDRLLSCDKNTPLAPPTSPL